MSIRLSIFTKSLILSLLVLIIIMPLLSSSLELWSSESYTHATIISNNHTCIREPWIGWKNPSGSDTINILWTDSDYVCHYEDGIAQDLFHEDKNCCPSGYECNSNNNGEGKCEESEIKTCSDYTPLGENACEGDDGTNHVGISDIESFKGAGYCKINSQIYGNCWRDVHCGCVWKGSACYSYYTDLACNGINSCKNYSEFLSGGVYYPDLAKEFCSNVEPPLGICITEIKTIDNCNTTNQKIIQWTKYISGSEGNSILPSECTESGTKTYQCLGSILSFFGISAAGVLILLVVLYYLLKNKKKSRKKKR